MPRTKWEKMSVHDAIARLEVATKKHHPNIKLGIDGISQTEIDELRKSIPHAPEQLFDLFEHYDFASHQLLYPLDPLRADQMKPQIQIDYFEDMVGGEVDGWTPDKLRCCKADKLWREKWIPIGKINGDPWFIDMDPTENGVPGQIVSVTTDGFGLAVKAYSLAHLLDRMAEKFENGESYQGEYSLFDNQELPPPRE